MKENKNEWELKTDAQVYDNHIDARNISDLL